VHDIPSVEELVIRMEKEYRDRAKELAID